MRVNRRRWPRALVLVVGFCCAAAAVARADPGPVTGLPMPRFVSLAVEIANLRVGPRNSYDVVAIYRRRGLPLKVVDEFDTWRQVEDHEGTRGWMHQRLLSGRRMVMVRDEPAMLRRGPSAEAAPILQAEPAVLGQLLRCEDGWCFVEIEGRRGWMPATGLWGVLP